MTLIPMITGTEITFWVCAVLAILGALGTVSLKKPVYSAMCLALVMVALAVIYASLGAPFLFAVQIIVYTGAVLMLFLFVIMLVGVAAKDSMRETVRGHRVWVTLAGIGVFALLVLAVIQGVVGSPIGVEKVVEGAGGDAQGLASLIFSRYVIAFEATAALLITAAVAAMVLAHPERIKPKVGQAERAAERLQAYADDLTHLGTKPSSGVFARHNSIATPALLPDGSVAKASVSQVLAERVGVAATEDLHAAHTTVVAALEAGDEAWAEQLESLAQIEGDGLDSVDDAEEEKVND